MTRRSIFINYRRSDEPGYTGWLYRVLADKFGNDAIFKDIEGGFREGDDFPDELKRLVANCDILLAVIGPGWIAATDDTGAPSLNNPEDWVRIEIAEALALGKRVIPVLVNNAPMPKAGELPENIAGLVNKHALRLPNERFEQDARGFANRIAALLDETARNTAHPPKPADTAGGNPRGNIGPSPQAPSGTRPERPDRQDSRWDKTRPDDSGQKTASGTGMTTRRKVVLGTMAATGALGGLTWHTRPGKPIWRLLNDKSERRFTGHAGSVTSVAFMPDGKRALSGGRDGTLRLWDLGTAETLRVFEGHDGALLDNALVVTGDTFIAGDDRGDVITRDANTFEVLSQMSVRHYSDRHGASDEVDSLALSRDGTRALATNIHDNGGGPGTIIPPSPDFSLSFWNLSSGEIIGAIDDTDRFSSVTLAPDGTTALYSLPSPNEIGGLDLGSRQVPFIWKAGAVAGTETDLVPKWGTVNAFSNTGEQLLTGDRDLELIAWPDGTPLQSIRLDVAPSVAAISPFGGRALVGSRDGSLVYWDLDVKRHARDFTGHTDGIRSIAFSAFGDLALTGSDDGTLRLWNLSGI